MTDRELLELAAKAAGLPYVKPTHDYSGAMGLEAGSDNPMRCYSWNPLTDDGDAFRLMVELKLTVNIWFDNTTVESDEVETVKEQHNYAPRAATRRAIVLAAAAIGGAEEMTNEEIRDFTKQSGLELYGLGQDRSKWEASLTRFAELVAAKEREACAQLLDDNAKACLSFTCAILQANADAIRAQGEN